MARCAPFRRLSLDPNLPRTRRSNQKFPVLGRARYLLGHGVIRRLISSVPFVGITWTDTTRKASFRWEHEAAFEDMDGTFVGEVDAKVVPFNPTLDPALCQAAGAEWSAGKPAAICRTSLPFHRFAWNNVSLLEMSDLFIVLR